MARENFEKFRADQMKNLPALIEEISKRFEFPDVAKEMLLGAAKKNKKDVHDLLQTWKKQLTNGITLANRISSLRIHLDAIDAPGAKYDVNPDLKPPERQY